VGRGDSISRAGTTRNANRVDLLLSYSGLVILKETLQDILQYIEGRAWAEPSRSKNSC
jgi:hypothetical protein